MFCFINRAILALLISQTSIFGPLFEAFPYQSLSNEPELRAFARLRLTRLTFLLIFQLYFTFSAGKGGFQPPLAAPQPFTPGKFCT